MSSDREDLTDKLKASSAKRAAEQAQAQASNVNPPQDKSETVSFATSYSLGEIGIFVDRWASLFPSMGDKTGQVQANTLTELKTRKVPATSIGAVKAYPGLLSQYISTVMGGRERPYIVATTDPGVTCAIYIGQYGTDLYTSWRTHIKGIINWGLLQVLAGISLVPAIIVLIGSIAIQNLTQQTVSVFGQAPSSSFNFQPTLTIMVFVFAFFLVSQLTFLALAGYFLKDGFLYYFFIEPTIFNAEDITALSAAVHQSILFAVDKAGIDTTKVETKKFNSGRRAERI